MAAGIVDALPIGGALTFAYALQWTWIAVSGSPLPLALLVPSLVVQFLLAAASLYRLLAQPKSLPDWYAAPTFAVLCALGWLAVWSWPIAAAPTLAQHPAATLIFIPLVVIAMLFASAVLAYPFAAPRPSAIRGAVRLFLRSGWRVRIGAVALTVLLASVWLPAAALIRSGIDFIVPFPAFGAFLFGLAQVLGWAAVFGVGLAGFRERVRVMTPDVKSSPDPVRPRWRPTQIASGAIAVISVAVAAILAPNFPLVAPSIASATHLRTSSDLALNAVPMATLREGGDAIGDAYAGEAFLLAMRGDAAGSKTNAAQALWWAPADPIALRTHAWIEVMSGSPAEARESIMSLQTAGDAAGYDQAAGLWLARNRRDGRPYLFRALESDQSIAIELPAGAPSPAIGGVDGQHRMLATFRDQELAVLANLVTEIAGQPSYSAALATDQTVRNLMAGSPGDHLKPLYEEDLVAAYAYAKAGDVDDGENLLIKDFNSETDQGRRAQLATISLRLGAGGSYVSNTDELGRIASYAEAQGNDDAKLAAAIYLLKVGDQDHARQLASDLAASTSNKSIKAWALALEANVLYQQTDYAGATQAATESLQLNESGATAMDDAIIGNCKLNLAYPNVDPSAESDILAAANANPYAFMLWYTLGQMEAQQHHWRAAIDYDTRALDDLELLSSSGLGSYEVVISTPPNHGHFYPLSSGYGYSGLIQAITSEIDELSRQGN